MNKATKGERLDGVLASVEYAGSMLGRNMGFETPCVEFHLADGRKVIWHSDAAGQFVVYCNGERPSCMLWAFVYGDRLRRVSVSAMDSKGEIKTFGMLARRAV